MSLSELFTAMNMFKQGVQEFATARGISQAQEQVEALKGAQMDELERRSALSNIANNLTLNLAKTGAPVSQVQLATGAIAPAAIKTPEEAMMQGALAGPGGAALSQLGQDVEMKSKGSEFEFLRRQQAFQAAESEKSRASAENVAGIRSTGGQNKLKPLSDKEIDTISSLEDDIVIGQSIVKDITASPWLTGPAAGRIPGRGMVDPKFAEFQQGVQSWFDQYRSRITGAGASDVELERLKKTRPNISDTPSQLAAKVRAIEKLSTQVRTRKLKNLEKAGRDVRRFEFDGKSGNEEAPASTPESSAPSPAPAFDINKYIKPSGASNSQPGSRTVASASFFQSNEPASTLGLQQGKTEQGDAYVDRLIQNQKDLAESKMKVPYRRGVG